MAKDVTEFELLANKIMRLHTFPFVLPFTWAVKAAIMAIPGIASGQSKVTTFIHD
jgi:hypothetical protein